MPGCAKEENAGMKILFIVPYATAGASNRYRVEQYLSYLSANGVEYDIRPFVFDKFYKILYRKGFYVKKTFYFIKALISRALDMAKIRDYDIIFIHRDACPCGPAFFEGIIHMLKKPIIYDFDDAIFMQNFSSANRLYRFFKFPSKTKRIIQMSSAVIVANSFLWEYARKFNESVYIIPTPIDTDRFNLDKGCTPALTIGWIGSPTTSPYLNVVYGALEKLSKKYDFVLKVVGAEKAVSIAGLKVENYEWQLEREVGDFKDIDIGIYPLPDTPWTRGKAAFKAIQYMAVGKPVVASAVGMTKELIQDGLNGFLAYSESEWEEKLSTLIEDSQLRARMGEAGRRVVEDLYSVSVNAPKLLTIIKRVYDEQSGV